MSGLENRMDLSAKPPGEDAALTQSELIRFLKKRLGIMLVSLFLLLAVLILVGTHYKEELESVALWVANYFGFWGLALLTFVSDSLISPLPPDLVLLVISKTSLHERWVSYVSILGVLSICGGLVGWWGGRKLGSIPFLDRIISKQVSKNRHTVDKYGAWAVAMGALTPLPYSLTCWMAGILRVRFRAFFLASLLRFPRFFIYYAVFLYAGKWFF